MALWVWLNEQHRQGLLAIAAIVVALGAALWLQRFVNRLRRRRIAKRAQSAEHDALSLLRRLGYVVLDTQVTHAWPVQHGARNMNITLRADAVVRRGSRRFIAEVKSSSLVADLRHGPTRRQLLEYAVAYGTDGVLLVDMHTRHVEEVVFPNLGHRASAPTPWSLWVVIVLMTVIGVALASGDLMLR